MSHTHPQSVTHTHIRGRANRKCIVLTLLLVQHHPSAVANRRNAAASSPPSCKTTPPRSDNKTQGGLCGAVEKTLKLQLRSSRSWRGDRVAFGVSCVEETPPVGGWKPRPRVSPCRQERCPQIKSGCVLSRLMSVQKHSGVCTGCSRALLHRLSLLAELPLSSYLPPSLPPCIKNSHSQMAFFFFFQRCVLII